MCLYLNMFKLCTQIFISNSKVIFCSSVKGFVCKVQTSYFLKIKTFPDISLINIIYHPPVLISTKYWNFQVIAQA